MQQDNYSFGQEGQVPPDNDQRSEFRLTGRARIEIELEAPDPEEGADGRGSHLACHTNDLSVNGLRIEAAEPLTPGALLPMKVALAGSGNSHDLTVEVVWCEAGGRAGWTVGLKILPSDETAYIEWVDAMARAMTQD